jgi:hypothetical protein
MMQLLPLNSISRLDAEAVGDRLWNRYLELAGNLAHVLALVRAISLFK